MVKSDPPDRGRVTGGAGAVVTQRAENALRKDQKLRVSGKINGTSLSTQGTRATFALTLTEYMVHATVLAPAQENRPETRGGSDPALPP